MEHEPKREALSIVLWYWLGHIVSRVSRAGTITFANSALLGIGASVQAVLLTWGYFHVYFGADLSSTWAVSVRRVVRYQGINRDFRDRLYQW
jgi:hypothetical protein